MLGSWQVPPLQLACSRFSRRNERSQCKPSASYFRFGAGVDFRNICRVCGTSRSAASCGRFPPRELRRLARMPLSQRFSRRSDAFDRRRRCDRPKSTTESDDCDGCVGAGPAGSPAGGPLAGGFVPAGRNDEGRRRRLSFLAHFRSAPVARRRSPTPAAGRTADRSESSPRKPPNRASFTTSLPRRRIVRGFSAPPRSTGKIA